MERREEEEKGGACQWKDTGEEQRGELRCYCYRATDRQTNVLSFKLPVQESLEGLVSYSLKTGLLCTHYCMESMERLLYGFLFEQSFVDVFTADDMLHLRHESSRNSDLALSGII